MGERHHVLVHGDVPRLHEAVQVEQEYPQESNPPPSADEHHRQRQYRGIGYDNQHTYERFHKVVAAGDLREQGDESGPINRHTQ